MIMEKFLYGSGQLTCSSALAIAKGTVTGEISPEVKDKIEQSASYVRKIVERGEVVYGINTGFGPLCTTLIDASQTQLLQENILKSHAVGMGEPIANDLAKLMLILKVHALSKGFSGVQYTTIERIIWHIENHVIPVVPKQGSVGASGDLAPLSHLFLPLIGLGKVNVEGEIVETAAVLEKHGMAPVQLGAKEGLALINGTQFMAAHGVMAVAELNRVLQNADIIATLMIEGLNGSIKPFFTELHQLRPHPGNRYVAASIFNMLHGSAILESHKDCSRVQDPYSLRCIPQVHGASRNA